MLDHIWKAYCGLNREDQRLVKDTIAMLADYDGLDFPTQTVANDLILRMAGHREQQKKKSEEGKIK
jgi:hypothetical protein